MFVYTQFHVKTLLFHQFASLSSKAILIFWLASDIGRARSSCIARYTEQSDWLKFVLKKLRRAPRGEI